MAIWIEIHCDEEKEKVGSDGIHYACSTLSGNNPGVLIKNISDVQMGLRNLLSQCIASGWIKKKGKIICPSCAE